MMGDGELVNAPECGTKNQTPDRINFPECSRTRQVFKMIKLQCRRCKITHASGVMPSLLSSNQLATPRRQKSSRKSRKAYDAHREDTSEHVVRSHHPLWRYVTKILQQGGARGTKHPSSPTGPPPLRLLGPAAGNGSAKETCWWVSRPRAGVIGNSSRALPRIA